MEFALKIVLMVAMIATVVSLSIGLLHLHSKGDQQGRETNTMMWLRVGSQGLALLIFAFFLFFR